MHQIETFKLTNSALELLENHENVTRTRMSNTLELAKATDLAAIPAQAPSDLKLEPRTRTPLSEESLEETIEEKTEEKRLTHTSHLLVPELDLAVARLATDDVPELLLLEIGETCFQAVHDHHLAGSLLEETTELAHRQDGDHAHPMDVVELPIPSGRETTHQTRETLSVKELLHQIAATIGHGLLPDEHTHLLAMREEAATDHDLVHLQESQPTKMTIGDHDLHLHGQTPAIRHADRHRPSIQIVRA